MRLGTTGGTGAAAIAERLGAEVVVIPTGTAGSAAAVRAALRAGDVDAVIHFLDDVPVEPAEGLMIAAVPKRGDARDALVASGGVTLDAVAPGARIGAGSALRRVQVLSRRPDVEVIDVRGDAGALIARVGDDLDAVILSAAGLGGPGRDAVSEFLGIDGWPTAPAQGAFAIEVREGGLDRPDLQKLAKLDHRPSRLATAAERGVLARLGSGRPAIGAHALLDDGLLFLSARVYSLDGARHLTSAHALYPEDVDDPAGELAERVADELLAAGADAL